MHFTYCSILRDPGEDGGTGVVGIGETPGFVGRVEAFPGSRRAGGGHEVSGRGETMAIFPGKDETSCVWRMYLKWWLSAAAVVLAKKL